MSVSPAKKLDWFDRGSSAFVRTFPGFLPERGSQAPPWYFCPICATGYRRNAVVSGHLTAEHVPPESFGGRELVLTCKRCNDEAGSGIDATRERRRTSGKPLRGTTTISKLKLEI